MSLFSHLQLLDSFKHTGHIMAPHPTQVLLDLLQSSDHIRPLLNNIASGFTICSYIYGCSLNRTKNVLQIKHEWRVIVISNCLLLSLSLPSSHASLVLHSNVQLILQQKRLGKCLVDSWRQWNVSASFRKGHVKRGHGSSSGTRAWWCSSVGK
jgi:hypothetical protein